MSAPSGTKAVLAALAANTAIALLKFGAWFLTGAASLLAEAIHSVADTSNQFLLLRGASRAKQKATPEHPFGYGRDRYISAFMVAIILFSLGGLFALYEAYDKYVEVSSGHHNSLLESPWWWVPIAVLGSAIVAEGLSFRTAIKESEPFRGRQTWLRFIKTAKQPELPVILLEDFAALLGLVFALMGVGMTLWTHNGYWDVASTALIGVLLIVVAVTLAIETSSLLLGEAASPPAVGKIRTALEESDGVLRIIHMKTLHLGPEEVLLAAKIAVEPTDTAERVARIIDAAEVNVRAAYPMVTAIYLEPDIDRGIEVVPVADEDD